MLGRSLAGLTSRRAATVCLAAAVAVSALLILGLDRHLTFIADDWELLVSRHAWTVGNVLDPFNEHIVIGPALVYKLLTAVFGIGSATPFYLVSISTFCLSAVLLFVYTRRRVGDWPAVIGAALVLFLGAAFEDLLWAFQFGFFASVSAGLGMLIALDRDDEAGDRVACVLLVVSMTFSSVALAFLVGAAIDVVRGRRPWKRRAYLVLLPLVLYGLWWAGWGHTAESHVSVHNFEHLPRFVFDSAAAGFTSLFGLATGDGSAPDQPHLIWGRIALILGAVLLGARLYRERSLSRGLAVALAIGLAFWILAGLDRDAERFPTSSRYQYPSAVFLLLIAAEALRGVRIPRLALGVAAVLTGFAALGGYSLMHKEYEERWQPVADSLRASLGAVKIAGDRADPGYPVSFAPSPTVAASTFLAVADESGSPGFDETELAARSEPERAAADRTMAMALRLALVPADPDRRVMGCQTLAASSGGSTGITLLHGGFTLANEGDVPVDVLLSRFASGPSVDLGPVGLGFRVSLTIPVDGSTRPWTLFLVGAGPVHLCTTASP